jgi:acetolactate synthase-1/2/3 large subunit
MPERTVVATLGDGSYLFNAPLSAHHVAMVERLPILIVLFNDCGYSTIKRSYKAARPTGWATKTGRDAFPLCEFGASMDYAKVAEAAGGVGLRVSAPSELAATLAHALALVRDGDRLVLVDVSCEQDC